MPVRKHHGRADTNLAISQLTQSMSSFAETVAAALSGNTPDTISAPQQQASAVQQIQSQEQHLSVDERVSLIELFTSQPAHADTYIQLTDPEVRKVWVDNRLKQLNTQKSLQSSFAFGTDFHMY